MAVGLGALATGAAVIARRRFERSTARRVAALTDRPTGEPARRFSPADVADLPPPVRRYFEAVLPEGHPHARTVRLRQRGSLRLGGPEDPWRPLTAVQHYAVDPPGFVWDATVSLAPVASVRVVDAYADGRGDLHARLFGAVPVADAAPGPEMNEAELARYLGEAVWFPTALLPAAGVRWRPRDDRSATATLTDGDVTATLTFHFGEDDRVTRVTTDRRYRSVDGGFEATPWTGEFWDYRERGGASVPARGRATWHLPDGDLPYWEGAVTEAAIE